MRIYTHPTIYLPAGTVVVKFYDDSKSGSETTPNIIKEIGDVEEGFDISFGELRVPEVEIVMHNKDNYLFSTLLDTNTLRVSVLVGSELYFYGSIDFDQIGTIEDDPSTDFHFSEISVTAISVLADLSYVNVVDFETNIFNNTSGTLSFVDDITGIRYIYMKALFFEMADRLGMGWDADFILNRKFYNGDPDTADYVSFDAICVNEQDITEAYPLNGFRGRLDNVFQVLGELCSEFNLYPSIIWTGSAFKLQIRERDQAREITGLAVVHRAKSMERVLTKIDITLDSLPDDYTNASFTAAAEIPSKWGDSLDITSHHTNILETVMLDESEEEKNRNKIKNGFTWDCTNNTLGMLADNWDQLSNLILNGADWIDTNNDGVANGYSLAVGTGSIGYDSGFTGKCQKVIVDGTTGGAQLTLPITLTVGKHYRLRFKYKVDLINTDFLILDTTGVIEYAGLNIATSEVQEFDSLILWQADNGLQFRVTDGSPSGAFFIIDDLQITEIWCAQITPFTGFSDNAQRIYADSYGGGGIYQRFEGVEKEKSYLLTLKHISSGITTYLDIKELAGDRLIKRLWINTDSPVTESLIVRFASVDGIKIIIGDGSASGSLFVVDEISLREAWQPSMLWGMRVVEDTTELYKPVNYITNYGDNTIYESFQHVILNIYKALYYNRLGWLTQTVHGLKAVYDAAAKLEYLQPGYNYTWNLKSYHIHTVSKSIMDNETEVKAIEQ